MTRPSRSLVVILSSAFQFVSKTYLSVVSSLQTSRLSGQPLLAKVNAFHIASQLNANMEGGDNPSGTNFTTNEEDQREAARLKERLRQVTGDDDVEKKNAATSAVPNVEIAEGAHKYVLISAMTPDGSQRQHFVVSKRNASYHRNAAEPFVDKLEQNGYKSIDITGGGRINLNSTDETIDVYGYSYGFGLADHALSKAVILADPRYKDFDVTWSNEGY